MGTGALDALKRAFGALAYEPNKDEMMNLAQLAVVVGSAISISAYANTIDFLTPVGATQGGQPVNAEVDFTTGAGGALTITLKNLQANPKDVGQNLSGLLFTLGGGTTINLSSSLGVPRNVAGNGTFTDLAPVLNIGWVASGGSGNYALNLLGTPEAPEHTIIGPPGAGGTYSNANGSIAGNGPHNPFLGQFAMFVLTIPGVTAASEVTSATFGFGTTPGAYVSGISENPTNVPDGAASLLLLGLGLGGLSLIRRKLG